MFLSLSCTFHPQHGQNKSLWKLGITHVVNAAHGRMYCQGSHDFYGATVEYYGVPADDSPSFDLSRYFLPTAEYIHNSLNTNGGKYLSTRVLVHCAVGVSRSASLVLAYLMIYHAYSLLEAINKVKECRWIFPNRGFLKQLRALDLKLHNTSCLQASRGPPRAPQFSSFFVICPSDFKIGKLVIYIIIFILSL
uniref:Dual specificity protein phosphatase n=1 Tax=Poecilia latipinna TaxID=48699 RepID=A0A3B3UPS8_9TELE